MKTSNKIIVIFLILVIVGYFVNNIYNSKNTDTLLTNSPKNATYYIDDEIITLKDGVSETSPIAGSAVKIITKYFGNEVTYDFNDDGRKDTVFIVTQTTGGSGTFYYLVAGINKDSGFFGSHALLIGDRIAPQNTEVNSDGVITVNYADRKVGESFAEQPSVGKSLYVKLDIDTMRLKVYTQ